MATNQQIIEAYESELDALSAAIQTNVNLLAGNHNDQVTLNETIETAENSIMLDVIAERFDVVGFPEYNKLKHTNAEQRKAAAQLAEEADTDYQALITQRNLLYAQGKALEAQIEFDRRQFNFKKVAMSFYATDPAQDPNSL